MAVRGRRDVTVIMYVLLVRYNDMCAVKKISRGSAVRCVSEVDECIIVRWLRSYTDRAVTDLSTCSRCGRCGVSRDRMLRDYS